MPRYICKQCLSMLRLAWELKSQSEKANKWLLEAASKRKRTSAMEEPRKQNAAASTPKKLKLSDNYEPSVSRFIPETIIENELEEEVLTYSVVDELTDESCCNETVDVKEVIMKDEQLEEEIVQGSSEIDPDFMELRVDPINTSSGSFPVIRVKTMPKESEAGLQQCKVCKGKFKASEIKEHMKADCNRGRNITL